MVIHRREAVREGKLAVRFCAPQNTPHIQVFSPLYLEIIDIFNRNVIVM